MGKRGARPGPRLTWPERIGRYFDELGPDDCWPWTGWCDPKSGYGQYAIPGFGKTTAHRAVYQARVGPIPEGLVLDHLCENTSCVNPAHMRVCTQRENLLRSERTFQSINARKTHCLQGHPYDEVNTAYGNGQRRCKACQKWQRNDPVGWANRPGPRRVTKRTR